MKDVDGNYWIYHTENSICLGDRNIYSVNVIRGCDMSEEYRRQLSEDNYNGPFSGYTMPVEEKVSKLCEKYDIYWNNYFKTDIGKFGLIQRYMNKRDLEKRILIPPIYDSWSSTEELVEDESGSFHHCYKGMLNFWNENDKENTLISFDIENGAIISKDLAPLIHINFT